MMPDYLGIAILVFCGLSFVQGFLLGFAVRFSVDGICEEWRKLQALLRERKR